MTIRNSPAVPVLTVQPEAAPSPVGCELSVDELAENPLGVEHAPEAAVHICTPTDLTAVPVVGKAAAARLYVTPVAAPAELESVIERPVICAASATRGIPIAKTATSIAKAICMNGLD